MRWAKNSKIGNTKTKHKFLLWPITIGGETRWLEFATIKYEYMEHGNALGGDLHWYWTAIEFIK